jgi:YVTN family beta-propeller protein
MGILGRSHLLIPALVAGTILAAAPAPSGMALRSMGAPGSASEAAAASSPTRTWASRLARIPLPGEGGAVLVTPDGKRLFVGVGDQTLVIRTRTRRVVGSLPLDGGIVLTPSGHRIMGVSAATGEFLRVSTTSLEVTRRIPVSSLISQVHSIRLDGAGNTAYLCGRLGGPIPEQGSAAVVAVDLLTDTLRAVLTAPSPYLYAVSCAAVHPSGSRLYVIADEQLQVMDVATGAMRPITYVEQSATVAFDTTGTRAYMADWHMGRVIVIDATTDTVLREIPVPTYPTDVELSSTGGLMYVLEEMDGPGVLAIDLATDAVIRVTGEKAVCAAPGCRPTAMALSGSGARMYVTSGDHSVAVLGLALRPPGAPRTVMATSGAGGVTVTWRVPKKRGSSAIRGYHVIALPTGQECRVGAKGRACTFAGLPGGMAHTFVVRAHNRDGMGAPRVSAPVAL